MYQSVKATRPSTAASRASVGIRDAVAAAAVTAASFDAVAGRKVPPDDFTIFFVTA
jgi:hypothetical protein